jgi:hypothetical protein
MAATAWSHTTGASRQGPACAIECATPQTLARDKANAKGTAAPITACDADCLDREQRLPCHE